MLVLPVPGGLPIERRDVVDAITFDFGNTLVPVDRAGLRRVVERTGERVGERLGPFPTQQFLTIWAEERERQFRAEVPRFREVDLADRFVRVLARLRGLSAPPADVEWDQEVAARHSAPAEIEWAVETYSAAFVELMPAPAAVEPLLERLARRHVLAILSNWPLAVTVDRFAAAHGWDRHLRAIVVSQRAGIIKPHPAIFAAALEAVGGPSADRALHVGDDWAADVVGAKRAGWRAAFLDARPADSPLPSSERDDDVVPDVEIRSLSELEAHLRPDE
ncbi:MAG TPA: HAD family hydrolase [Candidatus Limnocylindrales bacterium]